MKSAIYHLLGQLSSIKEDRRDQVKEDFAKVYNGMQFNFSGLEAGLEFKLNKSAQESKVKELTGKEKREKVASSVNDLAVSLVALEKILDAEELLGGRAKDPAKFSEVPADLEKSIEE